MTRAIVAAVAWMNRFCNYITQLGQIKDGASDIESSPLLLLIGSMIGVHPLGLECLNLSGVSHTG